MLGGVHDLQLLLLILMSLGYVLVGGHCKLAVDGGALWLFLIVLMDHFGQTVMIIILF
jgi:hypothetical protein